MEKGKSECGYMYLEFFLKTEIMAFLQCNFEELGLPRL